MPKTSLHWPKGREILWHKFKQIAEREGRSMSRILVEMIEEYVRIHEPGNPQKRLDVILNDGGPMGPVCSECGSPAERRYRTRYGPVLRCRRHRLGLMDPVGVQGWTEL